MRRSSPPSWLRIAVGIAFCMVFGSGARSTGSGLAAPNTRRQYCVTCHNDSLKTASISFQSAGRESNDLGESIAQAEGRRNAPARPSPDRTLQQQNRWHNGSKNRSIKATADHPRPGASPIHRRRPHRIRQCNPRPAQRRYQRHIDASARRQRVPVSITFRQRAQGLIAQYRN